MNVVISGASRGIGLALVREYLSAGHRVFAICRNPATAHELDALQDDGSDLIILAADVTDAASIAAVKDALGDTPVDMLLNIAGTLRMESQPEDIDFAAWAAAFDVMITGPFRMLTALLPNIEAAKGSIVSITSQIGASDWPSGGFYSYGAAKAGLNRAMKSLAVDLRKRKVPVAVIHPGHVKTDMGGPNGELTPEESARGIKAVADRVDLSTTGQFFNWDGSAHAW